MRTAEKQPETLPLATGMNQTFSERAAPFGTLSLVKNCRIRHGGSLVKRCGSAAVPGTPDASTAFYAISDTTTISRPVERPAFIGRIGDQKLAGSSAGHVFAYGGSTWGLRAAVSAAQPVRSRLGLPASIVTKPVGPYMPAVAVNSTGHICTAAGFAEQLKVTIESPAGDLLLDTASTVGAASVVVRIAVVGELFIICFQGTASTTITYWRIQTTSGGISNNNQGTLATLANASSTWDVSNYDGTNWWLVYQSGATTVTLAKMTAVTQSATATFSSTDNLTRLSVWGDSATARIFVGIVDAPAAASTGQYRIYTATPTLSVGPTSFTGTPTGVPLFGPLYTRTPVAGDAFCVFWDVSSSQPTLITATIQAGALTRQGAFTPFSVVPISKPDAQQRVWCMTYAVGSNFTISKAVLLRFAGTDFVGQSSFDPAPIVELASPEMETLGSVYHPFAQPGRAFHAVAVSSESAGGSTFFAFPFVLTSRTNAAGATEPTTRVNVYEYTRWNQAPHQPMVANGRAAYVAGQPTELYGQPFRIEASTNIRPIGGVELGFVHGPSVTSSTISPGAGGLDAGTYVYQAVYQFVDDEGNRQLSQPSEPFTVTLTVPSSVELQFSKCYLGQRASIDRDTATQYPPALVYRTQNGGTELQMVPIEATGAGTSWFTATDTVPDSIIDDNEFIYTAGGVLPNVLAPSCRYLAVSEERLWCGGLWASNIIECSKVRVPGEPFCFTGDPSHQVVIPGEVSGLAYMDGQVCVFTEDAIYLVGGDGPNDQGAGGFAPPRALCRGVGCPREQSASILETEAGILFRSKLGFYLIPRGFGSPQFIGGNVQDEDELVLSAATTTTSEHRLARFLVCAVGETMSDTVLTLDMEHMQWFRDEYTVNGSITGQGFSEIGEWPDGLALMSYGLQRTDNLSVVWAESESLTGDAGAAGAGATTYISQYIRTAWIQPWGPLGTGRLTQVVLACEPVGSSSALTVVVETDGNADQSASWTLTTSQEVAYRGISVKEPQCTEFRVTVSDAAGASNSAGVRLLSLGFETMSPGGIRQVTDSERQ